MQFEFFYIYNIDSGPGSPFTYLFISQVSAVLFLDYRLWKRPALLFLSDGTAPLFTGRILQNSGRLDWTWMHFCLCVSYCVMKCATGQGGEAERKDVVCFLKQKACVANCVSTSGSLCAIPRRSHFPSDVL